MRRIGDSKEVLPDYPNTVLAVSRDWAQKNRDGWSAIYALGSKEWHGSKIPRIATRQSS